MLKKDAVDDEVDEEDVGDRTELSSSNGSSEFKKSWSASSKFCDLFNELGLLVSMIETDLIWRPLRFFLNIKHLQAFVSSEGPKHVLELTYDTLD
ncbi:hypothetical protein BpHYR1_019509 [Brachionus plicatilis]|uniref:Uncharacterized protein n=1 Tax=Brachionus plicatilis TaxID=10195 RepID=A0A3M7SK56_BRAPC|nr:hypothetical protein BpHYR1_019509 [Brachionus plicatilis]